MASDSAVPGHAEAVLSKAHASLDALVDGISSLELWAVWLVPDRLPIDTLDLERCFRAFTAATIEVWHVSEGGHRSPSIKQKLRAFGPYGGLARELTSRATFDFGDATYYSDTARVEASHPELARFISRSTAGADSAIAVVPDSTRTSSSWAAATLPLLALWVKRSTILARPALGDRMFLAFIHAATTLGHIPIVLCLDASRRPALAAFASQDRLSAAATALGAVSSSSRLEERLSRRAATPSDRIMDVRPDIRGRIRRQPRRLPSMGRATPTTAQGSRALRALERIQILQLEIVGCTAARRATQAQTAAPSAPLTVSVGCPVRQTSVNNVKEIALTLQTTAGWATLSTRTDVGRWADDVGQHAGTRRAPGPPFWDALGPIACGIWMCRDRDVLDLKMKLSNCGGRRAHDRHGQTPDQVAGTGFRP